MEQLNGSEREHQRHREDEIQRFSEIMGSDRAKMGIRIEKVLQYVRENFDQAYENNKKSQQPKCLETYATIGDLADKTMNA